ncbi:endonuclease MutS2 [Salirhabdus sp. Marseille-P4669]|uniref:endonuclease MutS2 n=1 Tax=Salirhabdus sp. Marseille-P4669 TaxID=2042310 RepID=UPI000C7BF95A|nr:DNA mismatch repair protein [Salirhabdus sp. Marseille-P4669]
MNRNTIEKLEYERILKEVSQFALTLQGKAKIKSSPLIQNKTQLERMQEEVKEAIEIVKISSNVPIYSLDDVELYLEQGHKGLPLKPEQLTKVQSFLDHCRKLKQFMRDKENVAPTISSYVRSIENLQEVEDELTRCLKFGQIDDYATPELAKVRRLIDQREKEGKEKAEAAARSKRIADYLQEKHIVRKNGSYALQVKRQFKNKVDGLVVDVSSSGATVFITPRAVADIQGEVELLKMTEEHEVQQILYTLTNMILEKEQEINIAMDTMLHYDVLFAKAKHGLSIDGVLPQLNEEYEIHLIKARHPMLKGNVVPLSIHLDRIDRALVITGPNTGGKTVTLKTVGLLCMMAQTGLLIPAEEGSTIHLFANIFVDMGDGQSIDENLSTFSYRLKNMIQVLEETNDNTLVLLDELGSGTDPNEGMALAQVILEQLVDKGATLLATTHYSELKTLAQKKAGFINGSMEFDINTLQPTYKLLVGEAGNSQAFPIAIKLGMHPELVERAYELIYKEKREHIHFEGKEAFKRSYQKQIAVNRYARPVKKEKKQGVVPQFDQGDNVKVSPNDETGIVYTGPDSRGNYVIQMKGEKKTINHKFLKLHIKASELYPAGYDFDQIFKSKEERKKSRIMEKRHVEGLTIEIE